MKHWGGKIIESDDFCQRFRKKQLQPVYELLTIEQQQLFDEILPDRPPPKGSDYRLHSMGEGREIEQVAPKEADAFPNMSVDEITEFLNSWKPSRVGDSKKWWVEEDLNALAKVFVEHLEADPEKFSPDLKWWEKIDRPVFLSRTLSRAIARISKEKELAPPKPAEWSSWEGITNWIALEKYPIDEDRECDDWYWARMETVRFFNALFDTPVDVPTSFKQSRPGILLGLFNAADPRLATASKPWMEDWQSNAINSVQGTALEALLRETYEQKKGGGISDGIRSAILGRLGSRTTSPAIHALIGSRLRLFLRLFASEVRENPEIVLTPDELSLHALILSSTRYDHPDARNLSTLPELPRASLDCLKAVHAASEEGEGEKRDFGDRIGVNLAFYHWNKAFGSDETGLELLDDFFRIATKNERSCMISSIGTMFRELEASPEHEPLARRTQQIWDRRLAQLQAGLAEDRIPPTDYRREVQSFLQWLRSEAFDFDWRINRAVEALKAVSEPIEALDLLRHLDKIANSEGRLHGVLQVLKEIARKETRLQHWDYLGSDLATLITRGLESSRADSQELATEIRDLYLRLGHFELLPEEPT